MANNGRGEEDGLVPDARRRGRGAVSNRTGRFEPETRTAVDDGWGNLEALDGFQTQVRIEHSKSIINKVNSPDISFDRSINAYRGCEHGCIYCFARPTHGYLGYSAGLDFETRLIVKENAAELLRRELSRKGYHPRTMALGTNTDPYQPIERRYRITRQILGVLLGARHPVGIVTKSALVLRDLDILQQLAELGLVRVALSVTTFDRRLARSMEPRASTPMRRIKAIEALSAAGIPTVVMAAPVIPALNDAELEDILRTAADAGARSAGYILLRLPGEVAGLFEEWLHANHPGRASHVMSLMRDMHGGEAYRSKWGERMSGTGEYARLLAQRFALACKKCGLAQEKMALRSDLFRAPSPEPGRTGDAQLSLFENL